MDVDMSKFDEADRRYYDNIRDALNANNSDRLCELVPTLSKEEANDWITAYNEYSESIREKENAGSDAIPEITQQKYLIKQLLIRSKIPSVDTENN